jgi:hypothetical protein
MKGRAVYGTVFMGIVLFFTITFLYVITLPPRDITLKDIPPAVAVQSNSREPDLRGIAPVDTTETDCDDKAQVGYYIIVESNRNLTLAQKEADILIKNFNRKFIVLPPTTEGYYRISYGKYSTLEEAKSIIERIRTTIRSDAWILSVKK